MEVVESEGGRRVNQPTACLRLTTNKLNQPTVMLMAPLPPIEDVELEPEVEPKKSAFCLPKKRRLHTPANRLGPDPFVPKRV